MILKKVIHTTCSGSEDANCENFIQRKQLPAFKKHCPICASKTKEVLGVNTVPLAVAALVALVAGGFGLWQFSRSANSATQLISELASAAGVMKPARPEAPASFGAAKPTPQDGGRPLNVEDAARHGDYASIVSSGEAALIRTPDDATLLTNVGAAWLKLGDTEKARVYLQRATAIKPNDSYIRYDLGCVEARAGNKDLAVGHLRAACQLGLAPATFRQDSDLASLAGYKPFEDLVVNKMCR
jgi:tetratricopeptide (TPR) repeat protein